MTFDSSYQFKHSPRGVLLSQDYRDEVIDLMNDPRLQEMAKEVKDSYLTTASIEKLFDPFNMTMSVNKQYKFLGGEKQRSIGGPLWALKELLSNG